MKPITIYWRGARELEPVPTQSAELTSRIDVLPNPAKVVVILEELGLPYMSKYVQISELKCEPYVSINPNGRLPGTAASLSILCSLSSNICGS
jgi:hypothetical protein